MKLYTYILKITFITGSSLVQKWTTLNNKDIKAELNKSSLKGFIRNYKVLETEQII